MFNYQEAFVSMSGLSGRPFEPICVYHVIQRPAKSKILCRMLCEVQFTCFVNVNFEN